MGKDSNDRETFYKELLSKMLNSDVSSRETIAKQIKNAKSKPINDSNNEFSIEFEVDDEMPYVQVKGRLIAELEAKDIDNVPISALLFVDDGKISLLDIYKANGSSIKELPPASEFKKPNWVQLDKNTKVRE